MISISKNIFIRIKANIDFHQNVININKIDWTELEANNKWNIKIRNLYWAKSAEIRHNDLQWRWMGAISWLKIRLRFQCKNS